jgi:hypothetical protein
MKTKTQHRKSKEKKRRTDNTMVKRKEEKDRQ